MTDVRARWMSIALLSLLLTAGLVGLAGAVHGGGGSALPAPLASFSTPLAAHPALPAPAVPLTHGDLVVGPSNSPYVLSPLTTGSTTYFEEGNITVLPGGQLYVDALSVSFLQFIGTNGNVGQRVSHLYNFTVEGLAVFNGSVLTTNASVLNAYVKLTVTVTGGGTLVANDSTFAFPGWVDVSGSGSRFYANNSQVIPNPTVPTLLENLSLLHDTSYSPGLSLTAGARAVLTHTNWLGYYADNISRNGPAGVNLTAASDTLVASGSTFNVSNFALPQPTAPSLALAVGYTSWSTATFELVYEAPLSLQIGQVSVWYHGVRYAVSSNIQVLSPGVNKTGFLSIPVAGNLPGAVNGSGILSFLQATGEFGGGSTLNVTIANPSNNLDVISASLVVAPVYGYNMVASGQSNLTVADSLLDLNWNALPGTILDPGLPPAMPWESNKLLLSGGSDAFLANVSVPTTYITVFDNQSVVVPLDSQSVAYFYRWGQVTAESGGFGPIPDVHVVAYPAFASTDSNNATGLALNNLSQADPDLAAYVQSYFATHGHNYGVTDNSGNAFLLLISSIVRQGDLPTGLYLGSYHIGTTLPGGGALATHWEYGAVTAYPLGMDPAAPDFLPQAQYPGYHAELAIPKVGVTVDGAATTDGVAAIGDDIGFLLSVQNVGTASLVNFTVGFGIYQSNATPLPLATTQTFADLGPGATQLVKFNWTINETVIGLGGAKNVTFEFNASWNGGISPVGGVATNTVQVRVLPSPIQLRFFPPPGPLVVQNAYTGTGSVEFAGAQQAIINVTLLGAGGPFLIGQMATDKGNFNINLGIVNGVQPGQTYTIVVTAEYNHAVAYDNLTNGAVIAPNPAPPPSLLDQKVVGPITVWMLLAILAAAVAGVLAFLFVTGQFARGKLVECGECGSLIPEAATACPKCGAEFENDLVRCSRCGSTIPANSPVCPECAAQLLGTPVPDSKDPERQGYADFVERYRAEAKKELADNYGEGAFWDWWKRQPSFVPFNQWKLQQSAASRAGMTAPMVTATADEEEPEAAPEPPRSRPPPASGRGPAGGGASSRPPPRAPGPSAARTSPATGTGTRGSASVPAGTSASVGVASAAVPRRPAASSSAAAPPSSASAAAAEAPPFSESDPAPTPGLRGCANCGKEIPTDFLVCPFCGSVTR